MSFLYCPECGTKISEKAIACPHCGYYSSNIPIGISSKLNNFLIKSENSDNKFIFPMSIEQNDNLNELFGKAEHLAEIAPSLYETFKSMLPKTEYAIDLTKELQKKITDGTFYFTNDKTGQLMAQLKDTTGKIIHNCRIKEMKITPNLAPALSNLAMQAVLAAILIEVKNLNNKIQKLQESLQDDRFALADAALQSLEQAELINNSRIREQRLVNILNIISEAKCKLIYSYNSIKNDVDKEVKKFGIQSQKNINRTIHIYFENLYKIIQSVYIETKIYCWLGEQEAAKKSLNQFYDFLDNNQINRQSLLKINSNSDKNWLQNQKIIDTIDNSIKLIKTKIREIPKQNDILLLNEIKEYKYEDDM